MSEAKFTPGPWFIEDDMKVHYDDNGRPCVEEFINGLNIMAGDSYIVLSQGLAGGNTDRANANLIAAAPDLYDALQRMVNVLAELNPDVKDACVFEDARAALAKARGES